MGTFGGDFAVGRQAPPGATPLLQSFAVEPRAESFTLLRHNGGWQPFTVKIRYAGEWNDPGA